MSKQIKLGFDRIPVPATENYEILYDINSGVELLDADGNFLYTDVTSSIKDYGTKETSTPVFLNNQQRSGGPVKIIEQFPETSQVSSTLLGVPRSEVQLNLFADVSTYGMDENTWEYFTYIGGPGFQPASWMYRKNSIYGNRYWIRLEEVSNEQALTLTGYPVPWTYPFGPNFKDVYGLYSENLFNQYLGFIKLGNWFYDDYVLKNKKYFADQYFLSSDFVEVDANGKDVLYNTAKYSEEEIFAEVEKWTIAWMKLRGSELVDDDGNTIVFPSKFTLPPGYDASNTSPGYYSTGREYYGHLESKRTYRYQPGRISGFTYGLRCSTDQGSKATTIEWGCGNETDEYVFQVRGSTFNIVRRSVIPLPVSNLLNMGLKETDQREARITNPLRSSYFKEEEGDYSGSDKIWETVVPRDKFNGDPLDSTGPSGYIVKFENVTMWKIEFSWYGAIGAKFYCYVPSGHGEARWVLIHTWIIENQLGDPCLKDPFFKFKYMMYIPDTSNLREPQYIYKYGASYYIDGGDEGTVTLHNYSSNVVNVTSNNTRSVIGLAPKDLIYNDDTRDRPVGTRNRKDIIPQKMTVTSTVNAQIDVIDCDACPGFGHHYAPSIANGQKGIVGNFVISEDGTELFAEQLTGTVAVANNTTTIVVPSVEGLQVQMPVNQVAGAGKIGPGAYILNINSATKTITVDNTITRLGSISGTTLTTTGLTQSYAGAALSGSGVQSGTTIVSVTNETTAVVSINQNVINTTMTFKTVNSAGEVVFETVPSNWKPTYGWKKLIGNGLYSAYVDPEGKIGRRAGVVGQRNNKVDPSVSYSNTTKVKKTNGELVPVKGEVFKNVRLTGYDTIVASPTGLSRNKIRINFLNPVGFDGQHFAEFFVGLTRNKPTKNATTQELEFNGQPLDIQKDVVWVEWSHYAQNKDVGGYDNGEAEPRYGLALEMDPRIATPGGVDSGRCSQVRVNIDENGFSATYAAKNQLPQDAIDKLPTGNDPRANMVDFLVFTNDQITQVAGKLDGEIGIPDPLNLGNFIGSGVYFGSDEVFKYQQNQENRWCIPIYIPEGKPIVNIKEKFAPTGGTAVDQISLKTLTLQSRWVYESKVFNYDLFPLYVVIGLRDYAKINNITFEEEDQSGKFSYTPVWYKSPEKVSTGFNGLIQSTATQTRITNLNTTLGLTKGAILQGSGGTGTLGTNAYVVSVDSDTQITIAASTNNITGTIQFSATDRGAVIINSGKPEVTYSGLSGTITSTSTRTTVTGLQTTKGLRYGVIVRKTPGSTSAGAFGSNASIVSVDSDTQITIESSSNNTAGAIDFFATDVDAEGFSPTTGLFESGGKSREGYPATCFVENYRLDAGQADTQLQQPLRPGEVRSSFYIGADDTEEYALTHVYGPDRYTITPGIKNSKATFIAAKALGQNTSGEIQINVLTKEQ